MNEAQLGNQSCSIKGNKPGERSLTALTDILATDLTATGLHGTRLKPYLYIVQNMTHNKAKVAFGCQSS